MEGQPYQLFINLPFGETMAKQTGTGYQSPYKFNGKLQRSENPDASGELDPETGLYYYGARYYDPHSSTWLSVDPLAEKYAGWTPYNYCVGNPVVFVDPDGRKIKIYYQVFNSKGESKGYKSWTFNGKNFADAPRNGFIKNFLSAYKYNTKNGGGKFMKEAATSQEYTISLVKSEDGTNQVVVIFPTGKRGERQEIAVYWDPNSGSKTTDGQTLSPATILEEEFDHAVDQTLNPVEHFARVRKNDENYDNKEELRVKRGSVRETAIKNKEVPKNWKGEKNHHAKRLIEYDWDYKKM